MPIPIDRLTDSAATDKLRIQSDTPISNIVMDNLRARSVTAALAALALTSALLVPSRSDGQSEESLARFCVGAATVWATIDEEYIPEFAGNSPSQRGAESYWRHSFRGVAVPIPMVSDGWHFWIRDSNQSKSLAGLSNRHLNIGYGLLPSHVPLAIDGVKELATDIGLPGTDLDQMELVRAALEVEPEQVECDPNDVQGTVNALSAVYLKAFVLGFNDKAYLHGDGVLGHTVMEIGEQWAYLFEDESGQLYEVQIRHENPGRYPNIGFEIDDKVLVDSMYSLPWMPLFFEAASDPTRDRLAHLRDFIIDYPLPEETFESLDEKLAQFESSGKE